jgi:hypothetical protein
MLHLLIIAVLIASIALSKNYPKISSLLDLGVALLILFLRVIPGTAGIFDWIFMFLMFMGALFFFFTPRRSS